MEINHNFSNFRDFSLLLMRTTLRLEPEYRKNDQIELNSEFAFGKYVFRSCMETVQN